jgi:hypothetical protein
VTVSDQFASGVVNAPVVEHRVGSIERRLDRRRGNLRNARPVDSGSELVYSRAVKASRM